MSRVTTFRSKHPEIGTETTHVIVFWRLQVGISYGHGRYGYPDSPNFGLRFSWDRRR